MTNNYLAILVAAVAGFGFGAAWYMALGKMWLAANGFTREMLRAKQPNGPSKLPFVISVIANLLMAVVLAGLIGHMGFYSLRGGLISGAFMWVGFVITTLAVNNAFAMRHPKLLLIDGGHWLGVLLIMGGIIGAWGV